MTDTAKTSIAKDTVAKTSIAKDTVAKTSIAKDTVAKTSKAKAKTAGKGKAKSTKGKKPIVKAEITYSWTVKGAKSTPNQLLIIDGKERSVELGSTQKFRVGQFKATEPQIALISNVLRQVKAMPSTLALSCKAGYKGAQFGFTKANLSNSWSGFLTITDGELCLHEWKQRAISKQMLLDLAESNGLKPHRQGNNWFTIADSYLTAKYASKAKKFCLAVIKLVKA